MKEQARSSQQISSLEKGLVSSVSRRANQEPSLPLLKFHQIALSNNAYELLDGRRQKIAQAYFTTEATMGDLASLVGIKSVEGARYLILTSIETIFDHLPPEIQKEFKSPKDTLRLKSRTQTSTSRERIKAGTQGKKKNIPKPKEFTKFHKENLSAAASRRWQRERQARKATQTEEQE